MKIIIIKFYKYKIGKATRKTLKRELFLVINMNKKKFATRLNSFKSNWNSPQKPSVRGLIERASNAKGLTHVDLNFPDHIEPCLKDMSLSDTGLILLNLARSTKAITAYLPLDVNFINSLILEGYI